MIHVLFSSLPNFFLPLEGSATKQSSVALGRWCKALWVPSMFLPGSCTPVENTRSAGHPRGSCHSCSQHQDLRSLWGSSSRVEKGLLPAGLAAATGALTLSRARGHQGPSVVLAGGTRALPVEGTRDSRGQSPQAEAFVSRCVCTLTVSKAGSEQLLGFAGGPGSLSRFIQSGTV